MNNYCILLSGKSTSLINDFYRNPGAYRIATVLREDNWDVEVVDFLFHWPQKQITDYLEYLIKNKKPKWVGISSTWLLTDVENIKFFVKLIKNIDPTILVIFGGQAPYTHDLLADYYIFGYAEIALKKVLDYEFNDGPPVIHKKFHNGKLINAEKDYVASDLDSFKIEYVNEDFINDKTVGAIELSRGCKFKCSYCTFPYIGIKNPTTAAEEHLYKQFSENYQKWGMKTYYITDETLNDRTEKLVLLKNVVNRLDFKPDLNAFVRVDLLKSHPEQIELLAESNVWAQYYGVETLNHASGKAIGKGQNPEYVKQSLINIKDYFHKHVGKYKATVGMIIGLPYETKESIFDSSKWLNENMVGNGVNVVWWPLDIPKNGKLSALGQDFSKFGYKEMKNINQFTNKKYVLMSSSILWENEHMNIFEADKIKKFLTKDNILSNFNCWPLLPFLGYEKIISLRNSDLLQLQHFYMNKVILKYVFQKMALVKK